MMRFISYLLFLLFLSNIITFSQTYIGVSAGINTSRLSGDAPPEASYSTKIGYSAGLIADFTLSEDIVLSFQPRFLQRGTTISYEVVKYETTDSLSVSLDYLSFPVMVKIVSLNNKIFLSSGLDFGYLTSATVKNLMDGSTQNIDNLFKKFDLSAAFGFGMNFPIGITLLSFELRYAQSMSNISDITTGETDTVLPSRFRNSGFQLLMSFLCPI